MIKFKKHIDIFATNELRESVVLAIINNSSFSDIQKIYKTSRANTSLIKNNFIDYIYDNNKNYFNKIFDELAKNTIVNIAENKSYKNIVIAVFDKIAKKKNIKYMVCTDRDCLISEDFYEKTIIYVEQEAEAEHLPLTITKIDEHLSAHHKKILEVLKYHKVNHPIYFDDLYIYSFKACAYKMVDNIAEMQESDLPGLYKKICEVVNDLPKAIQTYDKYLKLVNRELISKKTTNEGLQNFLRIGKGEEGIVTRKKALSMFHMSENDADNIIKKCVEISKSLPCSTDSEFLLEKLQDQEQMKNIMLNPYLLKSLLVQSSEFIQERKFGITLKDSNCEYKTMVEVIEQIFKQTEKDELIAKDIYDYLLNSGKKVLYNNMYLVLRKNFKMIKKDKINTSVFSKKRIDDNGQICL